MSDNPENLPAPRDDRYLPAPRVDFMAGALDMLKTAIERDIKADELHKLLDFQERLLAKDAERQFADAMAAFQADCNYVGKNRTAKVMKKKNDPNDQDRVSHEYTFADLAQVAATIKPFCEKHGFSYKFNQRSVSGGMIEIDCIVRHVAGHKESTTFCLPTETPAAMSSQQKFGGATTFGRRYALCLAFGLTVGEDTDGREPEHEKPDQRADAPRPTARDQRQQNNSAPAAEDLIDQPELARLINEWKTQQAGSPGKEEFAKWALSIVPGDWNPSRLNGWTRERADACWRALGVPTE